MRKKQGLNMNSLVTCGWLHNLLRGSATKMKVLEASWAARGVGEESFLEQHIPSAHFFDMWRCCTPTQERPRALHNPECFEEYSQQLGINNDSHIVIYDKGPVYFAARLWFQFKAYGHENVSVVDGGMIKWLQENLPVESGEAPTPEVGNFKIRLSKMNKFISMEEFFHARESKCQIVDTRMPEHFSGETEEPNFGTQLGFDGAGLELPKNMLSGHVPGSANLCYLRLIDTETNCFLSKEEMQKLFAEAGYDPSQQLTGMCYSGLSVCILVLARTRLEQPETPVQVYDAGSFKVDTSLLKKYFKTFEEVSEKGFAETRQLVDTRHTEHFSGSLPEPSQVLKDKGIDLEKPVTTHCYNGIAACLIPLALSQLGKHTDVSVYQGSWTEYSQRATSDMVSKTEGHNGNAAGGG